MIYGEQLLNELREELAAHRARARADWERRCEEQSDDCAMLIHGRSDDLTEALLKTKITILEAGGVQAFDYWVDPSGERVNVRAVHTRYGLCNRVGDDETGFFASDAKLAKLGYKKLKEVCAAWAAVSSGGGRGFSGLLNCFISTFKSRVNYYTGDDAALKK